MALMEKAFVLSSQWRDHLVQSMSRQVDNSISDAVVSKPTDYIERDRPTFKAVNEYLKTRRDLLPTCRECNKLIDSFEFVAPKNMTFYCHGSRVKEVIADSVLKNQEKMYEYLLALKDKEVFFALSLEPDVYTMSYQTSLSIETSSLSPYSLPIPGFGMSVLPNKRPVAKPKAPTKLAPILPANRVKRAITFED